MFLSCLILATFFWFLNALSKHFTTDVDFRVRYTNLPKDKVVLNELPKQFKITIKGLGYDLMAYKLQLKIPEVSINLSKIRVSHNDENELQHTTLSTTAFTSYISTQLGEQIEIKQIFPDSIQFLYDKRKEKMVKIIPLTQINYEKQFQLFGEILVKPAITKVSGPASVIDTLNEVYTDSISYKNLSETITESVGFSRAYNYMKLKFKPDKVILHIPVEKFTETSKKVAIEYTNVPDSLVIKAIPDEVELKFMIPLSKMASLESAEFKAEIDYNQINDNYNHKLKVDITEYPDFIQSLSLNPGKVEYILKKRN